MSDPNAVGASITLARDMMDIPHCLPLTELCSKIYHHHFRHACGLLAVDVSYDVYLCGSASPAPHFQVPAGVPRPGSALLCVLDIYLTVYEAVR